MLQIQANVAYVAIVLAVLTYVLRESHGYLAEAINNIVCEKYEHGYWRDIAIPDPDEPGEQLYVASVWEWNEDEFAGVAIAARLDTSYQVRSL